MKIYTKTGDDGTTSLGTGKRVPKCDTNIQAVGDLDELNSQLGNLLSVWLDDAPPFLTKLQSILFDIGAVVINPKMADDLFQTVLSREVSFMETEIDRITEILPPLRAFIIPGGTQITALIHVVRAISRRAERTINVHATAVPKVLLVFVNRLSDYLFTLARMTSDGNEVLYKNWKKRSDV